MKKNYQLIIGVLFAFLLLCLSIVLWIWYDHSGRQSEPIKSSINESSASSQSVEETTETSSSEEMVEEKSNRNNIVDLSNDVLFIYHIKSPQIEKYWKAIGNSFGNLDLIQTIYSSKHPFLIVNGSGFSESFDPIGLQIKDGVLYSGWADASITNYAIESFVAMKDGSFRIFDYQTSPEQIISEGGNNSFTFGQSIIRDGVPQVSNGTADWMEYETVIGSNDENDLFVCVSKIETDYKTMQEILVPLGLTNALILDGGGSSQLMVNGDLVKESDDRRPLPEFILIN